MLVENGRADLSDLDLCLYSVFALGGCCGWDREGGSDENAVLCTLFAEVEGKRGGVVEELFRGGCC
jgi:hypothetical protein